MKRRLLIPLIFATFPLLVSSCATQDMIAKAQGRPGPLDPPNLPPTKPNPAYYALVPLVLPFDLVAWPFQYLYVQNRAQTGPVYRPADAAYLSPGYVPQQPPPQWQQ